MSTGTVQEAIPVWRGSAKSPFNLNCYVLASMLDRAADEVEKALAEVERMNALWATEHETVMRLMRERESVAVTLDSLRHALIRASALVEDALATGGEQS